MNKQQFLDKIKNGISCLPKNDIEHYIQYYSEMIDDRIEDGVSEEDAVAAMGGVDEIIAEILRDKRTSDAERYTPFLEKIKKFFSEKTTLCIILLVILCFPVWISLVSAVLSLAAVVISAVIGLYALAVGLAASFIGLVVAGAVVIANTSMFFKGLLIVGAGLVCAGVAVLVFLLARLSTKGIIMLVKYIYKSVKKFIESKKEARP